jgi:hypothetical protein
MRAVQHDCQRYATNKSAFASVLLVSNYHQTKSQRAGVIKDAPELNTTLPRPPAALP